MSSLVFALVLLASLSVPALAATAGAAPFVAYSLREAERRLTASGQRPAEVVQLGGITRLAGVVYDTRTGDLIIVGRVDRSAPPITLDDLVVAIRALWIHKAWPLVSIDKTPDTAATGKQVVRFEGGIAHTHFGNDTVAGDVVLKKLALDMLPTEVWGLRSYFALSAEAATTSADSNQVAARFWFVPLSAAFATRDGVVAITDLRVGVRTQVVSINGQPVERGSQVRDELGDRFAGALTEHWDALSAAYPEVRRLRALFDVVAVARGIQSLPSAPPLDYWLRQYAVPRVATPTEYPLLKRSAPVTGPRGPATLQVDGGVELKALVMRLRDGDVTALREAVLGSRPSPSALTWNPALDGWEIPGATAAETPQAAHEGAAPGGETIGTKQIGAYVSRELTSAAATATNALSSIPTLPPTAVVPTFAMPPKVDITSTFPSRLPLGNIGGVLLGGTATVAGGHAGVDLSRGSFALLVEGQRARLAPEAFAKFVTALWAVYFSDSDPGVSIDPIGPGILKHLVRYIGEKVVNSDLGRVMREADYLMKQWAVGTGRPDAPGFKDVDDLGAIHGRRYVGARRRFWFVSEGLRFRRGGDLLAFDSGRMALKTEYVLQNKGARAEPADEAFARFFTENYEALAARHPVLHELFEYAKLVGLGKYLKEQRVPLLWFLLANKDVVLTEDSTGTVDALVKGSRHVEGLRIEGGVDLATSPGQYVYDADAVRAIREARAATPATASGRVVPAPDHNGAPRGALEPPAVRLGNQPYSLVPQHTLTTGRDRRGLFYQTDLALTRDGKPGLELVRYFDPARAGGGHFGQGWHLLVPYRVAPAGPERRMFVNVSVPERMVVEHLLTGQREVLVFSTTRYRIAGYVPDDAARSRTLGLFLMSNGAFRLADKLGNEFHFDPRGRLTAMVFTRQHRVELEYLDSFTNAVDAAPYQLRPAGNDRLPFRNVTVPPRMELVDLIGGGSEILVFSDRGRLAGYTPTSAGTGRFEFLALMSDGSFRLRDRAGQEIAFTPSGVFAGIAPAGDAQMIRTVSDGTRHVTFTYTLDRAGHLRIASARLATDSATPPPPVVVYRYDEEGRLMEARRHALAVASVTGSFR